MKAESPTQCDHCKKVSSPIIKIRACARCFSVGYCSKDCQRADWRLHKSTCNKHRNDNEMKNKNEKSLAEVISVNSSTVRLETKCDDGSWQDVGPINLLNNIMHNNNSNSSSSRRKELSSSTKAILGNDTSCYTYRHSYDYIDENLIIFLHGSGDSNIPFDSLGQQMKLPQTATLSLSASMKMKLPDKPSSQTYSTLTSSFVELPFGLGYTWFEEMDYQMTGEVLKNDHSRRVDSLRDAVLSLLALLSSLTDHNSGINKNSNSNSSSNNNDSSSYWIPERVFLFGFSAGACLAMETCRLIWKLQQLPLGGCICIGGGIKTESLPGCNYDDSNNNTATDVLIITGSKDTVYTPNEALQSTSFYDASKAQIRIQEGKGHCMINSREEMKVVMEFLSKRISRRMTSMEGMCE